MAKQTINVGAVPNDPAADTARAGMQKVNSNFDELYDFALVKVGAGSITRSGGLVSTVTNPRGQTYTITRSGGLISSITNGTNTWSFTRSGGKIVSWSVT